MNSISQDNCTETPMRDHVEHFWRLLKENKVRILVDIHRPDSFGGLGHWDSSSFPDDVAKALVAERRATPPADMEGAVEAAAEVWWLEVNTMPWRMAMPEYRKGYLDTARRALAAADTALQRTPPDGWKTVPIELTEHMRDVAWSLIQGNLRPDEIWKYMVEAAPAAPVLADDRSKRS